MQQCHLSVTLIPKNANQISWPNHVAAYKIMNKFEYNFNCILLVHTLPYGKVDSLYHILNCLMLRYVFPNQYKAWQII